MNFTRCFSLIGALLILAAQAPAAQPLQLHPENPHYFLFRGKPTIIVTSGEHYGCVLNPDFDYSKYVDTLAKDGLNGTRTWSGAYCEPAAAFNIANNTLAPAAGRFLSPWARSEKPGYSNGGNKFDLTQWDESYFKRLKDFMTCASNKGVIVEMNLFCPFYEESMWQLSPMNASNNVNNIGTVARTNVYTLDNHGGLLAIQEAMVRKIVTELKDFDNLYYEICNEPYFGGVTLEWQRHIADLIVATEKDFASKHLISQNISNGQAKIENPHPAVSIFNFHYATPPEAVGMNYGLNRVIGDNETGFKGTNDSTYRMEGWDFIIAGGGLYNNLDYSFIAKHEDGMYRYPESQPGGGSTTLRRQLGYLRRFMSQFDYLHMRPDNAVFKAQLPEGATARALVRPAKDYILYVRTAMGKAKPGRKSSFANDELTIEVTLPAGQFSAAWYNTKTGAFVRRDSRFTHSGGAHKFSAPAFSDDIALAVRSVQ